MTGGEVYLSQVRTEFEGGYVQSRKRNTQPRRRWGLQWLNMSNADFALLEAAFIADQGNSFSWTEPVTSTVYSVRYSDDKIQWTHTHKGYRRVVVSIEEV
jgi:hypothetical protein